ncbi:MAG: N-acetyltransferase [Acidobacteria bacterium]|mgnify:FL=1|nr:N-acetyltransferase [Acidobacteriota bacterium]
MDSGKPTANALGGGVLIELPPARIHPTALVERDVRIGPGSSVWDNVHIRYSTTIGQECIVGEKTHISYEVVIGDRVKINAFVYICTAVTIEDGVMISAGTIFTNDRFPRATTSDLRELRTSAPDEHTLPTLVKAGATIGAGAIIGCGLSIGRFGMVGMGSVVTRTVPDFHLVVGNPARTIAYVCRCGEPFARFRPGELPDVAPTACHVCGLRYSAAAGAVSELG